MIGATAGYDDRLKLDSHQDGSLSDMTKLSESEVREIYWRENRRWMLILGTIWFAVSLGCGVLWVESLNTIQIGCFKLGF